MEIAMVKPAALQPAEITESLYRDFVAYLDADENTVQSYSRTLRQFFAFMRSRGITQPRREDILAYKEELRAHGKKASTISSYITVVRLFFGWTEAAGIYPNIAAHIKGAKIDRDHKKDYLTSAQARDILSQIDRSTLKGLRDYAMLALMLTNGLRTIEVSRSNVEDLRALADSTVLYIQGKGRDEKAEYTKIQPPVEKAIREYLKARGQTAPDAPLFASTSNNNSGRRMTTRSISAVVKGHMINAGYDSDRLTAHSLRHTAVTLSLLAGKPIDEVQQFARHSSIETTMIYNHALDKAKNGCSEAVSNALFD